jgi:sarcosine oxidase subunit alpha
MSSRLPRGGRIDRSRSLGFAFDGRAYAGHPGDTLASALLASDVRVIGSSIYRGRPRGVMSAGPEDPGALVQVTLGGGSEPMLRATEVELVDGLEAEGLAGRGRLSAETEPAYYDKRYVHCDVLVVGAGPAGLAAADVAAAAGARVMLADSQPELGGSLLDGPAEVDGHPALDWVAGVAGRLAAAPEASVLTRTTALGVYDAGYVVLAERRTDHLGGVPLPGVARQRLWHVRARRVVLCPGAHERAPVSPATTAPASCWPPPRVPTSSAGRSLRGVAPSSSPPRQRLRGGAELRPRRNRRGRDRRCPPGAGELAPPGTEVLAGHAVTATHARRAWRASR